MALLGFLPGVRAQSTAASLANKRQAALAAYDAGDTAAARPLLEQLAAKLPNDFAVQEALGLLLAEAGETKPALPHLARAAALHPGDAPARANYGSALFAEKEMRKAAVELAAAAALAPGNPDTEAELGRALFVNGDPKRAAEHLSLANRARPGDNDLLYDLALAEDGAHQPEAALQTLAATSADARTASLESLWGEIAERTGHFQLAAEHLQRAAQLDPSEPNLYALTLEFLRHWTWQAAGKIADFGIALYPDSQRLRFAKGVSLYGNGEFAAAADLFAPMLAAHPETASYADLLGRSCAALGGATSPSCRGLPLFALQHPGNSRAALYAAITLLHGPESDAHLAEAGALLKSSLTADPRNSEAWYQLGVTQQQGSHWAESEDSLQHAIALRPNYAEAHYRLSRAYAHQGRKDATLDELALQKRFSEQNKVDADAQLKEVIVFLTDAR